MNKLLTGFLLFLAFGTHDSSANIIEDLSRHAKYLNVKVSPGGDKLAVSINRGDHRSLAFFDTETLKPVYVFNGRPKMSVGNYYWVNDERVVFEVLQESGFFELPTAAGELFAINYDGSKGKMLVSYRDRSGANSRIGNNAISSTSGVSVLDLLQGNDRKILVERFDLRTLADSPSQAMTLDVYSGKLRPVKWAPNKQSSFLVDANGYPKVSSWINAKGDTEFFISGAHDEPWEKLDFEVEGELLPILFGDSDDQIFALYSRSGEPKSLVKLNLATQAMDSVYEHSEVDPSRILAVDQGQPFAIRLDKDYPTYEYLDYNSIYTKWHQDLVAAFRGDNVDITSATEDRSAFVVKHSSDVNPGTFYLFDSEKMQARYLLSAAPWIDSKEMRPSEPFRIKTDDGLVLNGYITLPKGEQKGLPAVIMPHGGPHARDYWAFDDWAQVLASQGYAVVKVNFRGSDGYGENFEKKGYGVWGTDIQDDIALAAKYVIQTGIADKGRICIAGASFGGYSAVQSAIRFPDLYQCAIGYVGVYDLPMLYSEGDIKDRDWGSAYLDKTLGKDSEEVIAQSPVHNVDKLKAPVFIIHGEDDQRAHFEHALALKDALEEAGHPYEWLVKDGEGHGFYDEKNRLEANHAMLKFLDKYIGSSGE
ncbi:alpha/beta hydrolase family protein [Microbulbifer agarilyticus]|uniref:alpha/beta hydrolase family protein n=1 Tax=Microbulbifer agarilyticus TaxID=260552 RepID=UPI001CD6A57F|nr:S9 family peptidase [Microbulbifer agarilyticus]MCA0892980.1 S9 family peptidase [Microbulbifer agarilyticus]